MQTTNTEKGKVRPDEVMIGNYLRTTLTDKIIEVDWLAIKHLHDGNIQAVGYDHSSVYEPIPLTEQWLKEFGFIHEWDLRYYKNASTNQFRPLKIIVDLQSENGIYISLWDEESETVIQEFNSYYVHQLQNLYFVLTHTQLHRTNTQENGK